MTLQFKADKLGAISGGLCLIHCVITPFVFIAKSCAVTGCVHTPIWWHVIDYVFIVISFYAILHATKHTKQTWLIMAFWFSWTFLLFAIFNETFEIAYHSEFFIYVPAIAIIVMHLYNHKYGNCNTDKCSVKEIK